jgi:micrococcal nuclease
VRLRGIDAPEMRGDERPAGIASRNALTELLDYRTVTLRTDGDKRGKYGRMIVDVWVGQVNANDWMVANGHAEIYE